MINNQFLFYFGHHRCGTTWMSNIIRQLCYRIGLQFVVINIPSTFDEYFRTGIRPGFRYYIPNYCYNVWKFMNRRVFLKRKYAKFIAFINADFSRVNNFSDYKGFHIIRDPRDILVSAYYSHRFSHSTKGWKSLEKHRKELNKVSKDEGLFIEMEFETSKKVFKDMYNWDYSLPNVPEIKMEDLIQRPYQIIPQIFEFLGIVSETKNLSKFYPFIVGINKINGITRGLFPFYFNLKTIPKEKLKDIIYKNRFSTKTGGRRPGEEDARHHYRKGASGDWVNHFNSDHMKYFKKNYNHLLLKLGYEKIHNWEKNYYVGTK